MVNKAQDLCLSLLAIREMLYQYSSWDVKELSEEQKIIVQKIRGECNEILSKHYINLDEFE